MRTRWESPSGAGLDPFPATGPAPYRRASTAVVSHGWCNTPFDAGSMMTVLRGLSDIKVRVTVGGKSGREELTPEILEQAQSGGRLLEAAPSLARPVEDRPDQRQAGALARQAADHLGAPPALSEGALQEVGVAYPLP